MFPHSHRIILLALVLCPACAEIDGWTPPTAETADAGSERTEPARHADAGSSRDVSIDVSDSALSPADVGPSDAAASGLDAAGSDMDASTPDVAEPDAPVTTHAGPVLYSADRVHSPITPFVADELAALALSNSDASDHMFIKVGASGTVNTNFVSCFANGRVDLDGRDALQATIDHFLQGEGDDPGEAGDTTPFDRSTHAAKVGRTARWAITGTPSPIELEMAATNPRFALVNYGTNDMQMGTTYLSAMPGYYTAYSSLIDQMIDEGIIPIVTGLSPRSDLPAADMWVPIYNTLARGIAQARQIPFLDMHDPLDVLDRDGLVGDGLHLNTLRQDGASRGCVFTDEGLEYGYNVRNLVTLEALDRVRRVLLEGEQAPDADGLVLAGQGSLQAPFVIPALPFVHSANTALSPHRDLNRYSGCAADQDESGPELLYRFAVAEATPARIVVMDGAGVDVDLHLLDAWGGEDGCIARAHQMIEGTLSPGTYSLAVDTFVSSRGEENAGDYTVVIQPCDGADSACTRNVF